MKIYIKRVPVTLSIYEKRQSIGFAFVTKNILTACFEGNTKEEVKSKAEAEGYSDQNYKFKFEIDQKAGMI